MFFLPPVIMSFYLVNYGSLWTQKYASLCYFKKLCSLHNSKTVFIQLKKVIATSNQKVMVKIKICELNIKEERKRVTMNANLLEYLC